MFSLECHSCSSSVSSLYANALTKLMYLKQIIFLIPNSGHWILKEVCLDTIFVGFLVS